VPSSDDRAATVIEENRLKRFPFRLGTLLFAVAIVVLLLVVVIQQVQIGHQQVQIRQMRQNIGRISIEFYKFVEAARELDARWSR
jgi:low affinity Fe/Cu permease